MSGQAGLPAGSSGSSTLNAAPPQTPTLPVLASIHQRSLSTHSGSSNQSGRPPSSSSSSTVQQSLVVRLDHPVTSLSISPGGRDVVLAAKRGLYIVNLDRPFDPPTMLHHLTKWDVADVQWNPHASRSNWIATTSNQKALIWNITRSSSAPTGGQAGGAPPASSSSHNSIEYTLSKHVRAVSDIHWSPFHPESIATCSYDAYIHLWDLRTSQSKPSNSFSSWTVGATQVKYNRINEWILASSHDMDVRIWDVRKGSSPLTLITAHMSKIYGIDWSRRDENEIITCSQDIVKFWNISQPRMCQSTIAAPSPLWRARFTPFGYGVVTMPQRKDTNLHLWSCDDRSLPVYSFSGHSDVPVEFVWRSQGGHYQLVTWSKDHTMRLWPVPSDITRAVGHRTDEEDASVVPSGAEGAPSSVSLATSNTTLPSQPASRRQSEALPGADRQGAADHTQDQQASTSGSDCSPDSSTAASNALGKGKGSHQPSSGFGNEAPVRGMALADRDVVETDESSVAVIAHPSGAMIELEKPAATKEAASLLLQPERLPGMHRRQDSFNQQHQAASTPSSHSNVDPGLPLTLDQEISQVEGMFPSVHFDKRNLAKRMCSISLQSTADSLGASGASVFMRVDMTFPSKYPASVAPQFEIQKTGMMSMANRTFLTVKLGQISAAFVAKSLPCVEACVRYLLGEPVATIPIPTLRGISNEQPHHGSLSGASTGVSINSLVGDRDRDVSGQRDMAGGLRDFGGLGHDGDDTYSETSSSDADTSLMGRRVRPIGDRRLVREMAGGRDNSNVPFPRLCGAAFSMSGKLVYFFSPLPHPSTTKFTAHTLSKRNQQPVLQSQHFSTQPKTYPLYENYRAFVLARYPKRITAGVLGSSAQDISKSAGTGAASIPSASGEQPEVPSLGHGLGAPLAGKAGSGRSRLKMDFWLDDDPMGDEPAAPSLYWRPKPIPSLQPVMFSSPNFLAQLQRFNSPIPVSSASASATVSPLKDQQPVPGPELRLGMEDGGFSSDSNGPGSKDQHRLFASNMQTQDGHGHPTGRNRSGTPVEHSMYGIQDHSGPEGDGHIFDRHADRSQWIGYVPGNGHAASARPVLQGASSVESSWTTHLGRGGIFLQQHRRRNSIASLVSNASEAKASGDMATSTTTVILPLQLSGRQSQESLDSISDANDGNRDVFWQPAVATEHTPSLASMSPSLTSITHPRWISSAGKWSSLRHIQASSSNNEGIGITFVEGTDEARLQRSRSNQQHPGSPRPLKTGRGRSVSDSGTRRHAQSDIEMDVARMSMSDASEFGGSSVDSGHASAKGLGSLPLQPWSPAIRRSTTPVTATPALQQISGHQSFAEEPGQAASQYGTVVYMRDMSMFLPMSMELARAYKIRGENSAQVCRLNSQCALSAGFADHAHLWKLAELILDQDAPMNAATKEGYEHFDQPLFQPPRFVPMRWQHHPFGQRMVHSLMRHLERLGNVQMLAMLVCVFSIQVSDKKMDMNNLQDHLWSQHRRQPLHLAAGSASADQANTYHSSVLGDNSLASPEHSVLQSLSQNQSSASLTGWMRGTKTDAAVSRSAFSGPNLASMATQAGHLGTPSLSNGIGSMLAPGGAASLPTRDFVHAGHFGRGFARGAQWLSGVSATSALSFGATDSVSASFSGGSLVSDGFVRSGTAGVISGQSFGAGGMVAKSMRIPARRRDAGSRLVRTASTDAGGIPKRPSLGSLFLPSGMFQAASSGGAYEQQHQQIGSLPMVMSPVDKMSAGIGHMSALSRSSGMAPDTHSSSAAVAAIADVDGAGMAMPGGGQAVLVIREYGAPDDEDEFGGGACLGMDTEATPQAELLDPACRDVYNSYLWQYGEMLFAWGLLEQRNELFKFLKFVQPFNALAVEASADTRLACDKCGQETKPGVRQHHQRHPPHTCLGCGAGVPGIRCVLCRTIVKGMILVCPDCKHGGHPAHLRSWFATQTDCATGCGCECRLKE